MPQTSWALHASGDITREDYTSVLIPAAEKAMAKNEKVRVLMEIADDAEPTVGAMFEDAVFGTSHLTSWDRIAIVTDVEFITKAVRFMSALMPFQTKLFTIGERDAAKAWVES